MNLFSLAKKNVTGNFKSYMLYFLSMIFSVVIYYTFVSLQYSSEVQQAIESSNSLLNLFIGASVILILFVAIFIFYSNSFFTKKRKKEVGLYSLLGLRKKTIGKMLFYENIIMSAIAIVIGIILGTVLSRLFTMIMLRLLNSTIDVSFGVSAAGIINTFIVFSVISLFTSFHAYRLIYRFKLIELFQAEKEGEQIPKTSITAAFIAVILVAFSYWLGFQSPNSNVQILLILVFYLFSIILGTYLLFRFLTVYLLRFLQKRKRIFYRGINVIGISQLLYRINGNARTLTVISLLSAVTIGALSLGYSFYYTNEIHAERQAPFSFTHVSTDESIDKQIEEIIIADLRHPVIGQIDIPVINVEGDVSNPILQDYLGEGSVKIISEGTYNEALEILDKEGSIELSENQAAGIQPLLTEFSSADYQGQSIGLHLPEGEKGFTFVTMLENRVLPWSYPDFSIVVSDQMFAEIANQITPINMRAFEVEDEIATKEISASLEKFADNELMLTSFYHIYRSGLESAGLNLFILGFLGLVFLAATGSIIYFKQLTEAHQDKSRYEILHKIGVSTKEAKRTVKMQTLFVFGLPLIIGVIHGLVMLQITASIFSVLSGANLTVPIILSILVYMITYLGYYLLTVSSVNKIVNK